LTSVQHARDLLHEAGFTTELQHGVSWPGDELILSWAGNVVGTLFIRAGMIRSQDLGLFLDNVSHRVIR
jgi:hypothetical protein